MDLLLVEVPSNFHFHLQVPFIKLLELILFIMYSKSRIFFVTVLNDHTTRLFILLLLLKAVV